jgi:hypothetical protein
MLNKALNSPDKLRPLWGPDRRRSGPRLFAGSGCKFSFVLPFWGGVLVRCVFTPVHTLTPAWTSTPDLTAHPRLNGRLTLWTLQPLQNEHNQGYTAVTWGE